MDSVSLKEELKKLGIDENYINIGEEPRCDECFNLVRRGDGRWEVFYGEHGQKTNLRIFETEEEAEKAFLETLRRNARRSEAREPFFARWKRRLPGKR